MKSKKYNITLNGCHDYTEFEIELNKKEFELIKKISELSEENSRYDCMPTLEITEVKEC